MLNISATLHYHGTPLQIHASAAKAGVDAVTKNLAVEWGRFGIRVVRHRARSDRRHRGHAPARARRHRREERRARSPPGRFGTIDEIAAAAVFLRSPRGRVRHRPRAGRRRRPLRRDAVARATLRPESTPRRRVAATGSRRAAREPSRRSIFVAPRAAGRACELVVGGRGHYERVIAAVLDGAQAASGSRPRTSRS